MGQRQEGGVQKLGEGGVQSLGERRREEDPPPWGQEDGEQCTQGSQGWWEGTRLAPWQYSADLGVLHCYCFAWHARG